MRKLVAALGVLALAAGPVAAQGTYSCSGALESVVVHDGDGGFAFKTGNPSGPSDWFAVDFDNSLASCKIVAICVNVLDVGNPNKDGHIGKVGIYPDNLAVDTTGQTPDVGNPIVEAGTGSAANGAGCNTAFYFLIPAIHLTANDNVHVGYNHQAGDSAIFVCSDGVGTASGRSSITTNGYATSAGIVGIDWYLGAGIVPKVVGGGVEFVINGSLSAKVTHQGRVALSFYGPEGSSFAANPGIGLMAFTFCPGGIPSSFVTPILPIGFNGVCPDSTTICGTVACTVPAFPNLPFCAMYLDATDTKPNGKPKLKFTNVALLSINANPVACGFCYGQQDDGAVGLGAWTTAIPTGTGDWFNVKHGTPSPASGVMTLTGVEVANVVSSGTCGGIVGNPDGGWGEVGIYPANLAQDSTGGTPDVANPVATVSPGTVANGTLIWGYPGQFFDTPDVAASGTIIYHAAVRYSPGDSCLRVSADDSTGAGPDPCGTIPSTTSFSTTDGYATNALNFSVVNWLLKIDWK